MVIVDIDDENEIIFHEVDLQQEENNRLRMTVNNLKNKYSRLQKANNKLQNEVNDKTNKLNVKNNQYNQLQETNNRQSVLLTKMSKEKEGECYRLHIHHLTKESPQLSQFVQLAKKNRSFKKKLYHFITFSRTNSSLARAAANALTILHEAGESFSRKNLKGIHASMQNSDSKNYHGPDLRGADLKKVDFRGADLRGADLRKADFTGADLRGARFEKARLYGCVFRETLLASTQFSLEFSQDVSPFVQRQQLEGTEEITSVVFSPTGSYLAAANHSTTVQLWNVESGVESGKVIRTFEGHTSLVYSIVFSPTGDQLATASHDKTVRLWNVENGSLIKVFKGHTGPIWSVVFSHDSKQLASASQDNTMRLWDVENGSLIKVFKGHTVEVTSVVFSPDGKQLATASHDKTVRLWNVESGKVIRTFVVVGYIDYIDSVVFSPDGHYLASTATNDNMVRLWDLSLAVPLWGIDFTGSRGLSLELKKQFKELGGKGIELDEDDDEKEEYE